MKYKLINKRTKKIVAEAVDIGGTLYVHYYDSRGSFSYDFGKWPSMKTYIYKTIDEKIKSL